MNGPMDKFWNFWFWEAQIHPAINSSAAELNDFFRKNMRFVLCCLLFMNGDEYIAHNKQAFIYSKQNGRSSLSLFCCFLGMEKNVTMQYIY